jgi:hypothetical protein
MNNLREFFADAQHVRITLYCAGIAAISIAVYVYGVFNR